MSNRGRNADTKVATRDIPTVVKTMETRTSTVWGSV